MESKVFIAKMFQQDGTIVAVIDGESYTVTPDSRNYAALKEAFKNNDADAFYLIATEPLPSQSDSLNKVQSVDDSLKIEVVDGKTYLNGVELSNKVAEAIYRFAMEGIDYQPLVNFLKNLLENTSRRAIEELYQFLEVCGLSITEDGCFLAYKTVRDNYLDKYSGKFDNSPGAVNKMARRDVDDDCSRTCSYGFHVGALAYAGPGGWYNNTNDKVVICKVNPRDVVSVPLDHSFQKLRCCEYTVVSDFKNALGKVCYSGAVSNDDYDDEDDDGGCSADGQEINPRDALIGWEYEISYYDEDGDLQTENFVVTDKGVDYLVVECFVGGVDMIDIDFQDIECMIVLD